jgi:hypothetical protein
VYPSPGMSRRELCVIIFVFTLAAISSISSAQEATVASSGRLTHEISLLQNQVKDALFAHLLEIISTGMDVGLDREQMNATFKEFNSTMRLPFDTIDRLTQTTDEDTGMTTIRIDFTHEVSIPIPFTLLFYHPGRILSSQHLVWETSRYWFFVPENGGGPVQAIDLAIRKGSVQVKLDEWLKVFFSAHFEDTRINHIIIFRWKGHVVGLLSGVGQRTGRVLRAYFDFAKNGIIFPAPADLNRAGKILCNTPE